MEPNQPPADRIELLQRMLDMLILRTHRSGAAHGHEIVQVEHGSLYPALHRLEQQA